VDIIFVVCYLKNHKKFKYIHYYLKLAPTVDDIVFRNFISSALGINFNSLKSAKNHGERKGFFPHQDDFLKFALR
jgi:hypothetical protein